MTGSADDSLLQKRPTEKIDMSVWLAEKALLQRAALVAQSIRSPGGRRQALHAAGPSDKPRTTAFFKPRISKLQQQFKAAPEVHPQIPAPFGPVSTVEISITGSERTFDRHFWAF